MAQYYLNGFLPENNTINFMAELVLLYNPCSYSIWLFEKVRTLNISEIANLKLDYLAQLVSD